MSVEEFTKLEGKVATLVQLAPGPLKVQLDSSYSDIEGRADASAGARKSGQGLPLDERSKNRGLKLTVHPQNENSPFALFFNPGYFLHTIKIK